MAAHYVIISDNSGQASVSKLKRWVNANMLGVDPNFKEGGTTYEWRNALINLGWILKEKSGNVYLVKPDADGSIEYAKNTLNSYQKNTDKSIELKDTVIDEFTSGFEKYLQDALRNNIQLLEPGLEIIDGGKERNTILGSIDITARDSQGRIVVIEYKAPVGKPDVIAQTLAHMEAIRREEQKEVRGIIVADDFADRVKLAARQVPNLRLIKYAIHFNFDEVE